MSTRYTGLDGEAVARDYLTGAGYVLRAANVRIAGGEIDIIAEKDGVIAFIEVKRRTSKAHGRPAEAVTYQKRRKIISTALAYAAQNGLMDSTMRFDVLEILPGEVRHIESAFDSEGSIW